MFIPPEEDIVTGGLCILECFVVAAGVEEVMPSPSVTGLAGIGVMEDEARVLVVLPFEVEIRYFLF